MPQFSKKLLLISPVPPPIGGIATWTEHCKDYCENNDIYLRIVNTAMIGIDKNTVRHRRNLFAEILRTIKVYRQLQRLLKEKFDIVHINTSCGRFGIIRDYISVIIAKQKGCKVIVQYHCNISDQIKGPVGNMFLKKIMSLVDANLVLNEYSREHLEALGTHNKLLVIPNFITMKENDARIQVHESIKKVIFVGHVLQAKGCYEIINVAWLLPGIKFIMIGPIDSSFQNVEIPNNVEMLGAKKHEQIKKYLLQADAYIFPSYSEGFSISLLEAMAVGLPIITTDVGANKDIIENKGGILIPVKDHMALACAISKLQDKELRVDMSKWNINKVASSYSMDVVMKKLMDIYDAL